MALSRILKPNCFGPNKKMLLDSSVSSFPPGFKRIKRGEEVNQASACSIVKAELLFGAQQ